MKIADDYGFDVFACTHIYSRLVQLTLESNGVCCIFIKFAIHELNFSLCDEIEYGSPIRTAYIGMLYMLWEGGGGSKA